MKLILEYFVVMMINDLILIGLSIDDVFYLFLDFIDIVVELIINDLDFCLGCRG
jgi:hypothetical protein